VTKDHAWLSTGFKEEDKQKFSKFGNKSGDNGEKSCQNVSLDNNV
jgi:hypothetical protein